VTKAEVQVARTICTAAELQVVELVEQGMSQRQIASFLGISREAVRDRLERAARKIDQATRRSA